MKIAFIADARNVHTKRWALSLSNEVDELFVISIAPGSTSGCKVYNLNMINEKGNKFITLIKKLKYVFLSWIILLRNQPDIIHVHYLRADLTIFSYLFFKNVIISVWGNDIIDDRKKSLLKSLYRKIALKRAAIITATTHFLALKTQKYCSDREIVEIPFGVDLELFKKTNNLQKPKRPVSIGFVKHLTPKYGPHILVEAARLIKNEVLIYLLGEGWLKDQLIAKIRKYKLQNIVLKGFVPNNELPKFLNNIDIFVMPSIYESETFGVAAIEAQAMDIPVIASDIGGIGEAVLNGSTGILIQPDNPKVLAETIDNLIEDRKLYEMLKSNCRKFVEKEFNWNENVQSVIKLYHKLL